MKTLTLQMISKLNKNKTNVSSPLFGGSHSKPWSCTRWHSAGSAIALHHAHSRGPPSARTSCSLLRWSLWKPLMAGQHSYQHTIRRLWRCQRPASLCHFSQSSDVCILSACFLFACKKEHLPSYLAYAFSSRGIQNSFSSFEWTDTSWLLIVGRWSSTTTSTHFPNLQNWARTRVRDQRGESKLTTKVNVLLTIRCQQITLPWNGKSLCCPGRSASAGPPVPSGPCWMSVRRLQPKTSNYLMTHVKRCALSMLVSFVPQQFTEVSLTQRPLSNVIASGPVCAEDRLLIFALSLEKFLEQSGIITNLTFCMSWQK